jgi:lycopene cyclase domain-containing protein
MTALTYMEFHAALILPPLVALLVLTARDPPRSRSAAIGLPLMAVIALVYTTPWDNYLIGRGVWRYGEGATLAHLWNAPVGEYLFFVLQPIVTGLWLYRLSGPTIPATPVSRRSRIVGAGGGAVVGAAGLVMLSVTGTYYLGAILVWAAPILALQWGVGWPILWRARRRVALGTLVPTLYLAVADRIAIAAGIWEIDPGGAFTTGLFVAGLPIEEGAFFLVTNLFVVQGLLLLGWVVDRWIVADAPSRAPAGERAPSRPG